MQEISQQIDALAATITEHLAKLSAEGNTTKLLVAYFHLTEQYKRLDVARKGIFHIKDHHDKKVIPELFETLEQDKIQVPEVARSFYPLRKYSASIVDKPKAFEWLQTQGLKDIIQPTVNAQTLASAIKDKVLQEGIDPPPDAITFTTYSITGMSKYTPKS